MADTKREARKLSGQRLSSGGSRMLSSSPLTVATSNPAAASVPTMKPMAPPGTSGRSNGARVTPRPRSVSRAARLFATVCRSRAARRGFCGSSSTASSSKLDRR